MGVVNTLGPSKQYKQPPPCLATDTDGMSSIPSAAGGSLADLFAADDRVHFSKETGTWRFEQEDGAELEYDTSKSQWLPVVSGHRSV